MWGRNGRLLMLVPVIAISTLAILLTRAQGWPTNEVSSEQCDEYMDGSAQIKGQGVLAFVLGRV